MSQLANSIKAEIDRLIGVLVEQGFADDQVMPFVRKTAGTEWQVSYPNAYVVGAAGGRTSYREMHAALVRARDYSVKLPDGALLQFHYELDNEGVSKHRLAFLPHPDLEEYQNEPELYEEELIFAEICELGVVATPIRFDFDRDQFVEMDHPMSHLTIGQYKNCRVAVSRAVSPFLFVHFIMNAFYKTAANEIDQHLGDVGVYFDESIAPSEKTRLHISC